MPNKLFKGCYVTPVLRWTPDHILPTSPVVRHTLRRAYSGDTRLADTPFAAGALPARRAHAALAF